LFAIATIFIKRTN